eukprot:CAMPEP_0202484506 /NCGR_PEP_ID=MMETSP1361-20130828/3575_1 /ASSEMBLY_ACC=CAM_ASM_000849 /TAXON_ID=210615 /ORGANISM="Staurosira complex sp., Strain CCMP2646" /LENGTH=130 /DNA_ID=CAMNT_0049113173 /DNA_START=421 /DNA_END=813 /DNA_ORIENTATION=-
MAAAAVLLMKMVKKRWMLLGQEGLRPILRLVIQAMARPSLLEDQEKRHNLKKKVASRRSKLLPRKTRAKHSDMLFLRRKRGCTVHAHVRAFSTGKLEFFSFLIDQKMANANSIVLKPARRDALVVSQSTR